jgi:hypothetical protein
MGYLGERAYPCGKQYSINTHVTSLGRIRLLYRHCGPREMAEPQLFKLHGRSGRIRSDKRACDRLRRSRAADPDTGSNGYFSKSSDFGQLSSSDDPA